VRDVSYVKEPLTPGSASTSSSRTAKVHSPSRLRARRRIYIHGQELLHANVQGLRRAGYLVLNVNYRRAPRFRYPVNISDVGAAVAWLWRTRRHTAATLADVPCGRLRRRHLVSTYSTSLADGRLAKAFRVDGMKRPRIAGLVLFYGAFDCETVLETGFPFVRMMLRSFLSRDPGLFKERARDASPIRHIKAAYPLLSSATHSRTSSTPSPSLRKRTRAAGRRARGLGGAALGVPADTHGFAMIFWRKCAKKAMGAAIRFLDERKSAVRLKSAAE